MSQLSTCRHVLANGALCQAASLRNREYCRFHLQQIGRRMRAARARARQQAPLLKLPLLEDLYSVQVALMQLSDAIAYREIEPQYARLLTTVLRLAMQNLKSKAWDRPSRFQLAETDAAPTAWDTFEQEHDLPPDLDLSLDPEVAFPPIEEPAGAPFNPSVGMCGNDDAARARIGQILRDAETPVPGSPVHVTADEVEIMDVLEREGNDAMMQVIAQQQRNNKRRERRTRRLYYEEVARNRTIQMAAQKMVKDQGKAVLQRPSSPVSVADEVAEAEAAFTRKPPLRQEAAPKQNSSTREA
ncbi:MAG: hypothetical protein WAM71_18870 [Candidatus Korobacteraceae bacterium]